MFLVYKFSFFPSIFRFFFLISLRDFVSGPIMLQQILNVNFEICVIDFVCWFLDGCDCT